MFSFLISITMSRRETWVALLIIKAVLHEESFVSVGRGWADGLAVRAGCHRAVLRRRRRRKHGQLHRYVNRQSYRERDCERNGYRNGYRNDQRNGNRQRAAQERWTGAGWDGHVVGQPGADILWRRGAAPRAAQRFVTR
jgi:hypothetical protein